MCLAVPARIVDKDGGSATIDLDGVRREISLLLCPEATVGQYALVHAGFAITILDEEEARKGLEVFARYRQILDESDPLASPTDQRGS